MEACQVKKVDMACMHGARRQNSDTTMEAQDGILTDTFAVGRVRRSPKRVASVNNRGNSNLRLHVGKKTGGSE